MTQTLAIFYDAYRDLSARRLFWITLILSGVVVIAFGVVLGVKGNEMHVLKWHFDTRPFSAQSLYLWFFSKFIIGIWLTWAAVALALISTAGIFPDLLASGTVDLYLARPIGRLRFFLTKYVSGLLFVAMQVTVFTLGSFVVLGLRAGLWRPTLFLAIPLVVCVFSYLFAACVLFGVWTRSAIFALLLTLVVWGVCSGFFWADQMVFGSYIQSEQPWRNGGDDISAHFITVDHVIQDILVPLPKIVPTSRLLDRWLMTNSDQGGNFGEDDDTVREMGLSKADLAEMHSRDTGGDPAYTIGTSLAFEVVVVSLAAWIFCRRDY